MRLFWVMFLFFTIPVCAFAQKQDSLSIKTENAQISSSDSLPQAFLKSPQGTALKSALIPGWGQVSNRQWWKTPIIYAGLATSVYFISVNNKDFQRFRTAYRLRTDGDSTTIDEFDPSPFNPHPASEGSILNEQSLLSLREDYRRNRDLSILVTVGIYAANIIDAYVFAQLKDFDVSDNLSLSVEPINFTNIAMNGYFISSVKLKIK